LKEPVYGKLRSLGYPLPNTDDEDLYFSIVVFLFLPEQTRKPKNSQSSKQREKADPNQSPLEWESRIWLSHL
jgi:hypothetical protein